MKEDVIVNLSPDGNSEIGQIPRDVGLERLRFDGHAVVDLATLDAMWVRQTPAGFELHAVEVPGAQRVAMRYSDRRQLYVDNGVIRVKSPAQIAAELDDQRKAMFLARAKGHLERAVGPLHLRVEYVAAIVTLLIEHALNPTQATHNALTSLLSSLRKAYPVDELAPRVKRAVDASADALSDLWSKL